MNNNRRIQYTFRSVRKRNDKIFKNYYGSSNSVVNFELPHSSRILDNFGNIMHKLQFRRKSKLNFDKEKALSSLRNDTFGISNRETPGTIKNTSSDVVRKAE
ncbi:hypothetical protein CEXT_708331 [Caerostris extrusa]|uniref:Uncharacterized protein n=1 Tax=Caerostris extrusa TaxID=172846 RepID=A0AAV4WMS6_CAEEX|nr:hypothetical protein CEXT_708331 [Caerostris extrusa]